MSTTETKNPEKQTTAKKAETKKTSTVKKATIAPKAPAKKKSLLRSPTFEEVMQHNAGKSLSEEAKQVVEDFLKNNPEAHLFLDSAKK